MRKVKLLLALTTKLEKLLEERTELFFKERPFLDNPNDESINKPFKILSFRKEREVNTLETNKLLQELARASIGVPKKAFKGEQQTIS